jgi:hypothetical protein
MVKELIESGAVDVNEVDYTDRTALHAAAAAGHRQIVQYLVSKGADQTIKDSWGISPVGKYVCSFSLSSLRIIESLKYPLWNTYTSWEHTSIWTPRLLTNYLILGLD